MSSDFSSLLRTTIKFDDSENVVGAIRIVKQRNGANRVSPIYIVPEHQGKGIAQKLFEQIEQLYEEVNVWQLDTILQEQKLCALYEKIGYQKTGAMKVINDSMTIVFYEKSSYRGR